MLQRGARLSLSEDKEYTQACVIEGDEAVLIAQSREERRLSSSTQIESPKVKGVRL